MLYYRALCDTNVSLLSGLKWDDNKSHAWRDGLSCQASRRYVPSFAERVFSQDKCDHCRAARNRTRPRGVKLVLPHNGVNIDPSPVSRSYCRSFRSASQCRSYHDLAEVWSYNPAPFAPQETPVILHPGITASKHLRRLVTAECDGPCGKRDPHPVCITKCSNGA